MTSLRKALFALAGLLVCGSLAFAFSQSQTLQGNLRNSGGPTGVDSPEQTLGDGSGKDLIGKFQDGAFSQNEAKGNSKTPGVENVKPKTGEWGGATTPKNSGAQENPKKSPKSALGEVTKATQVEVQNSKESVSENNIAEIKAQEIANIETPNTKESKPAKSELSESAKDAAKNALGSSIKNTTGNLKNPNTKPNGSVGTSGSTSSGSSGASSATASTGTQTSQASYLRIRLVESDGSFISGASVKNFSLSAGQILNVVEEDQSYLITLKMAGSYDLTVKMSGYLSKTNAGTLTSTSDPNTKPTDITLYYGRTLTVTDQDGNLLYDYTATAGLDNNEDTTCKKYIGGSFGCAFPSSATQKGVYKVSLSGYQTVEGEFDSTLTQAASKAVAEKVTLVAEKTGNEATASSGTSCSNVDLRPDTFTMLTKGEPLQLTITVKSNAIAMNFWSRIFSNIFLADVTTSEGIWNGKLIVSSDGKGKFTGDNGDTGNPVIWDIDGQETTVTALYNGGKVGDTITAFVKGEGQCQDTLVIGSAPATGVSSGTNETPGVDTPNTSSSSTSAGDTKTSSAETNATNTSSKANESTKKNTSNSAKNNSADMAILNDNGYTCNTSFTDIDTTEQKETICRLYDANVIGGRDHSHFAPQDFATRAEFVKMLLLVKGLSSDDGETLPKSGFQDVHDNDWFSPYMRLAENLDITRVRDAGATFNPNVPLTRADAAVYGARAYGYKLYNYQTAFKDVPQNSSFAYAVMYFYQTLVDVPNDNQGEIPVINGYDDGNFRPYDYLTRADAAALIYRMYLAGL